MIKALWLKWGSMVGGKSLAMIVAAFSLVFADATISVNWGTVKRTVDPLSYGVNGSYAYQASQTTNPAYLAGIKYAIGKPDGSTALLRLHRQAIVAAWSPGGTWNATTITSALKPLMTNGFNIMIDFDRAIGGNGMDILPNDAAALVKIVNVDAKLGVKYWEIYNENGGSGPTRGTEVKACIKAMKAVDSTIKVGGTAMSYLDQNFYLGFAQNALPDLDFVSYHGYDGGATSGMSDASIYDWAVNNGSGQKQLRTMLTQQSPNKYIPILFDEYNISWDWTIVDSRTTSNKGGVFSALVMVTAVDNGADVSNRWNESEPAFAFMTSAGAPLTVAHVYHLFNLYCYGDQVTTTTSDAKSVVAYAVKSATRHSLVLINRAATQQTANVSFIGYTPGQSINKYQVWTRNGIDSSNVTWTAGSNALVLPDNSVTVLTISESTPVVVPQIRPASAPTALYGDVNVEIYSVSAQRLSAFVVKNSSFAGVSQDAIVLAAQRNMSRSFGTGLHFMVLKTATQQIRIGPIMQNARNLK